MITFFMNPSDGPLIAIAVAVATGGGQHSPGFSR
jgi:hypothetical protein